MKRKGLFVIIPFVLLLGFICIFSFRTHYPTDLILNYADYQNGGTLMELELEDYIVRNNGLKTLVATNKTTRESFYIATDAFDIVKQNAFLISGKGNTVYYVQRSPANSGSEYYACDLENRTFQKLKSYNQSTNIRAFMGIENPLGVKANANDFFFVVLSHGQYIICAKGIFTYKEMSTVIKEKDAAGEFFAQDSIEKMGYCNGKVYFINGMNEIIAYNVSDGTLKRCMDNKIADFYLYEDHIAVTYLSGDTEYLLFDALNL